MIRWRGVGRVDVRLSVCGLTLTADGGVLGKGSEEGNGLHDGFSFWTGRGSWEDG